MTLQQNSGNQWDVVIMGGGPAGAIASAVLAMNGRRVAVVEKDLFPRYHLGESMIPYCYFPLNRVGMIEKLNESHFPRKYSVQFAALSGKISEPFYFFDHFDHPASMTWQVLRSEFDTMLLNNAAERGAKVFQGYRVTELMKHGEATTGFVAQDPSGEPIRFEAPLTIDATGRTGFAARRNGWRIRDPRLQKISLWSYYRGAVRDPGYDAGATTVAYLPEKGWCWYIPLPDDVVSVGVVADRDYLYRDSSDPEVIFEREVGLNGWVREHLAAAKRIEAVQVTGDYSYRSRYCAANGLILTGDAFAFLDPVFSSGLYFALLGGELAADAAEEALESGDFSAQRFESYGRRYCAVIESMRKLVYAFYDPDFSFRTLFERHPEMSTDVTDCLIGNLERDFTQLFDALNQIAEIPPPLPHGRPQTAG